MSAFRFGKGKITRMLQLNPKDLTTINKSLDCYREELLKTDDTAKRRYQLELVDRTKRKLSVLRNLKDGAL